MKSTLGWSLALALLSAPFAGCGSADRSDDPTLDASRPALVVLPAPDASPGRSTEASASAVARSFRDFRPSRDGFGFVNSFPGDPISLGGLQRFFTDGRGYGLCGGMSLAAADHFLAGAAMPMDQSVPARGTRLHSYLLHRQVDSLGTLGVFGLKFLKWQRLPDASATGTWALTRRGLDKIVSDLESGAPVMLGLVYRDRDDGWNPAGNHQVLGYAVDVSPGRVLISIYDPNFPGRDDVRLEVHLIEIDDGTGGSIEAARTRRVVPGRSDREVRGVFAMPYSPRPPLRAS
ncbi:MAG: hypothetical protein H6811_04445 [Phycisphaeraceae bacterium]|nr:hypothetical protein [Phycisphaeraceae bacterium]